MEKVKYSTYRGAGHVSMLLGLPLIPCLILISSLIGTFFIFVALLNWVVFGMLIMSIILVLGVWLHLECAIEPRALEIRFLEIKGVLLKLKKGAVLEVTSMAESANKEQEDVERIIKTNRLQ